MSEYQEPKIEVAPHAEEFENGLGLFPGGWSPSSTAGGMTTLCDYLYAPSRTHVVNAVFIATDPVLVGDIQVGVCCSMCGQVHRWSMPGTCADKGEPLPARLCEMFKSSFHNVPIYVVLHPIFRPGGKLDRHKLNADYEQFARKFLDKWERGARVVREAIRDFEVVMQNAEKFHKPKLDEHYTG